MEHMEQMRTEMMKETGNVLVAMLLWPGTGFGGWHDPEREIGLAIQAGMMCITGMGDEGPAVMCEQCGAALIGPEPGAEVVQDWESYEDDIVCIPCFMEINDDVEITRAENMIFNLEHPDLYEGVHRDSGCRHREGYCYFLTVPAQIKRVEEYIQRRCEGSEPRSLDEYIEAEEMRILIESVNEDVAASRHSP